MSLSGATRSLSEASICTSNLETLFGGLMAYVSTYNSFPPHNPWSAYRTPGWEYFFSADGIAAK